MKYMVFLIISQLLMMFVLAGMITTRQAVTTTPLLQYHRLLSKSMASVLSCISRATALPLVNHSLIIIIIISSSSCCYHPLIIMVIIIMSSMTSTLTLPQLTL